MRILHTIALLLCALTASAQDFQPDRPGGIENELRAIPRPFSQAAWYDPSRSGSGIYFSDVRPGTAGARLTSLAYYTYTNEGAPLWLTAVGSLSNATSADIFAGRFGGYDLQLQESRGGPCPNCPRVPNSVSDSGWGRLQLDFTSPYSANLRVGGVETGTSRASDLNLGNSIANVMKGQWVGTERARRTFSPPGPIIETACTLTLRPGANPAPANVWIAQSAKVQVPARNAEWLDFSINSDCIAMGFVRDFKHALAVDPASGKAIMPLLRSPAATAIYKSSGIPGVNGPLQGFELSESGYVFEFWLQDYNTLIVWGRHHADTRRVDAEYIFTRVNPI
jgi:hypothetical protein